MRIPIGIIKKFNWAIEKIVTIFALIGGVGLISFVVLINIGVIKRYFLNSPISWSEEVSTYLLVLFVYSAMAYALKVDGHVSIDLLYIRLPERKRKYCNVMTDIFTFVFWILVTWQSFRVALGDLAKNYRSDTLLSFPLFYPTLLVSIGGFLVCLQALSMLLQHLSSSEKKE